MDAALTALADGKRSRRASDVGGSLEFREGNDNELFYLVKEILETVFEHSLVYC